MPTKPKSKKPKKPTGRPSLYSDELATKILDAIANSTKGLATICKQNSSFPHAGTVRRWITEDRKGFRDKYTRAKEEQADLMADEILDITDALPKKGLTNQQVNAARLKVDARKWVASKLKPKKYGDKIDHTTDGESMNKGFMGLLMQTSNDG